MNILTYSGIEIDPLKPDEQKIAIVDIAHALSLLCRANGHVIRFYSVAQHSINCAYEAMARGYEKKVALGCLLHDASEAYISDITRPVKPFLGNYTEIEKRLQDAIYTRFLDELPSAEEIKLIFSVDNEMLVAEFATLMKKTPFSHTAILTSTPNFSERNFQSVEKEYMEVFEKLKK